MANVWICAAAITLLPACSHGQTFFEQPIHTSAISIPDRPTPFAKFAKTNDQKPSRRYELHASADLRLAPSLAGTEMEAPELASGTASDQITSGEAGLRDTHKARRWSLWDGGAGAARISDPLGSSYIPVDNWIYPAMLRLYSMGYLDTAFLSLRPWTRRGVLHMLEQTEPAIQANGSEEALELLDKLKQSIRDEPGSNAAVPRRFVYGLDSSYVGVRAVSGTVLRDSWHLGQSFINDYGRPYSNGANTYDGLSTLTELGPFSLYVRAEVQHAPSYAGYSLALAQTLSKQDQIPYSGFNLNQATIPQGLLPSQNNLRVLEANFSAHVIGHEISFGKSDAWLGPGVGGAMAWSNNAENIYSFRINRVEPLVVPYVSSILGPIRYDFFIGSLKGHTSPNSPWIHSEVLSFSPTRDLQLSFQRSIIFGGKGHAPVTLHSFLKGFFDLDDVPVSQKFSRNDPGARFSSFTFSYRLPFVRRHVTLYTDSITHDDPLPISAPRRAGWRPGIYVSTIPGIPKLDFRVEESYTDYGTRRSIQGQGVYDEQVQLQGYTNKGFIIGDWMGREAKGGQAWLTYHLSGNESISFEYLRKKNGKDFAGGSTQNTFRAEAVKRIVPSLELNAWIQYEGWKAPFFKTGGQSDTTGAFQLTWYPRLKSTNDAN